MGINTTPSSNYDLYVGGKSVLGGNVGIGVTPSDDYRVYISGKILLGGQITTISSGAYETAINGSFKLDGAGIFNDVELKFRNGLLVGLSGASVGETASASIIPSVSGNSGKFLSNNGSSLLWKSIGLSVVSNANNTSLGSGISSSLGTTYSVVVEDNVSASIPYSGTASGVWLGWDSDSTGRIYSSEYSSSSAASRHKYYTYASGQGYSGTAKGNVSARLVGSILAKVTSD